MTREICNNVSKPIKVTPSDGTYLFAGAHELWRCLLLEEWLQCRPAWCLVIVESPLLPRVLVVTIA